jgi:hypothetical protein
MSMMKIEGSASGSISQRHGSADSDPDPNPHCFCGIAISVVDPDLKLKAGSGSGNSPKNVYLFIMSNLAHLLYKAEYKDKIYVKNIRKKFM